MKRTADPSAGALDHGLQELGLDSTLRAPLLAYLAELKRWNAAYNLTSVRDPLEMVTRHLLDSLALLPALVEVPVTRLLDVGSGAGLPGIPLALARPDWHVTVLDSNGKKVRFLRHAVRTLGLVNVEVVDARAEQYMPDAPYDAVVSRAFSALAEFLDQTRNLLAPGGHWLAMKGRLDDNELAAIPPTVSDPRVVRLTVPGMREERHLVIVRKVP
ncbi:MAG: 16S rRNA (guanine(527)-N(7))-methyltransferase RsmG [Panacagrimonas sp.]